VRRVGRVTGTTREVTATTRNVAAITRNAAAKGRDGGCGGSGWSLQALRRSLQRPENATAEGADRHDSERSGVFSDSGRTSWGCGREDACPGGS